MQQLMDDLCGMFTSIDTTGEFRTFAAYAKSDKLPEESGRSEQETICAPMQMQRTLEMSPKCRHSPAI
jgi:hypothetical protein